MRKQHLSKFITILFAFITVLLINTLNSYSVKAAENENNDEYYLLTKDCYYIVENNTDEELTFDQYYKDKNNNYIRSTKNSIDYCNFDDLKKPPMYHLSCIKNEYIVSHPNNNVLFTTEVNNNTFVKIPSACKVTKINEPYWKEYLLKKGSSLKIEPNISVFCCFRDSEGNPATFDKKTFIGEDNKTSSVFYNWSYSYDTITYDHPFYYIYADYEDVYINIPAANTTAKLILLPYPSSYKYIVKKGESVKITYSGHPYNSMMVGDKTQSFDYIQTDSYYMNNYWESFFNYNCNEKYGKMCNFPNNSYSYIIHAGYDTDVTIKILYDDIDKFSFSSYDSSFKDFTINPHEAIKIKGDPICYKYPINIFLSNSFNDYYYEKFNSNDNKFIDNSMDDINKYDISYQGNSIDLVSSNYIILENVSSHPVKFRLPSKFSHYVSPYVIQNREVIYSKYDLNKDDSIDLQDVAILASNYNLLTYGSNYSKYDLNKNNVCDIYDLSIMLYIISNILDIN